MAVFHFGLQSSHRYNSQGLPIHNNYQYINLTVESGEAVHIIACMVLTLGAAVGVSRGHGRAVRTGGIDEVGACLLIQLGLPHFFSTCTILYQQLIR